MHALTRWFLHNPVAANLFMALILFMGIMTTLSMRIEGFPRVPPDSVVVSTAYPGAPAAQIDALVTQKIEQALEGLEGVRSITSETRHGVSVITVRKAGGQDLQKILDRVRLRIDGVTALPKAVKRPVIQTTGFDFPALYVNLYGETDAKTLQTLTKRLKEELLAQPELSRLKIWGLHQAEMRIEVDPKTLQQFGLIVEDIMALIRKHSLNFQAGTLKTKGGKIYLKAYDRAKFAKDYAKIPVIERPDGAVVLLGDIATIKDDFEEGEYLFRFNGEKTSGMEILVGQKENLLRISEVVQETVQDFEGQLPEGIAIAIWGDSSNYIEERLALLQSNGIQGLLLVMLLLALFLDVRLAFWVAMGIPISVMGALAVAGSGWVDYSLNDITTFGLIIALGILVDDAVVVGESVFVERKKVKDPILGTEQGVSKVAIATICGVLTTIAAFFPMMLIDNPLGKVLAGFSGMVIFALIFSLLESKFILPAHLAPLRLEPSGQKSLLRFWQPVQDRAQKGLVWFRDQIYAPCLIWSLRHKYAVCILFISAGVFGLGVIGLGKVKTVFFPDVPGQIITVGLSMDARAPYALTKKNIEYIHKLGDALNTELQERHGLEKPPFAASFLLIPDANTAQIFVELTPVADRPGLGILDIVKDWRQRTGAIEGATELQFTGSEELAGGFKLKLQSKDPDLLSLASQDLRQFLSDIAGVNNIRSSLVAGQPELEVRVKPEARHLGFDTETLASQIGYAFGGAEVQKIRRAGQEYRVLVRNAETARDSIDDLLKTELRSHSGRWVPLGAVAEVKSGYAAGVIHRENSKRVSIIEATIDRSIVAPEEVGQAVSQTFLPKLEAKYPSVSLKESGELEEMGDIKDGMQKALLISAALIFVLMAIPLKSYWQPFVILAIVPFGFVGAAMGHLIMDLPLSLLSFFGMLALTGVVVNDSLVLITRYNQAKEEGLSLDAALQDAGLGRFQAIFLTTATTVLGLLPLLLETSEQAQYLIPAAASLAFGEIFATALMLIFVPVLIAIIEEVLGFFRALRF